MLGLELDYTALQVLADLLFLLYSPLLPCGSMWSPPFVKNKEISTHVYIALRINVVTTSCGKHRNTNTCVRCPADLTSVVEYEKGGSHGLIRQGITSPL